MIIKKCEVCESKDFKKVLNLGLLPLCDDLIKIIITEQDLQMMF